ncbi:MAG: ureidoglycolate lyase [Actinomycetota bacterium]
MTVLRAEELTTDTFSAFGHVIEQPAREQDADGPGWQWWAETSSLRSDGRPWTFGYLHLRTAPLRFDWAERHLRTQEVVLAGSSDVVVYVGPADPDQPDRLPPLESFRAFRVPAGRGIVMEPGVWHGAPLALGDDCNAVVLLLEGTGRDDVVVVRFEEEPVDIEMKS